MKRRVAIAAVLLCAFFAANLAYAATVTIYPGAGVGGARLGAVDTTAVKALKKVLPLRASGVGTYAGQGVYYYGFGTRLSNKHYPVEMFANGSPRVFAFEIYSPVCVTTKGIRVGSTETQLKRAYSLRKQATSAYYVYSSGGMLNRTEYYVKRSTKKVVRIRIFRY